MEAHRQRVFSGAAWPWDGKASASLCAAGRILLRMLLVALLCLVGFSGGFGSLAQCQTPQQSQRGVEPGKDAMRHRRGYFGPGRDEPEPDLQNLLGVSLGYFGPPGADDPEGGTVWLGVNLALDEANASGGYKGLPFLLSTAWAENAWVDGSSKLTRLAYLERVWAIFGAVDGGAAQLAGQVASKALVTMMDPASTGESVNEAGAAWVFSCLPSDRVIAAAMGRFLLDRAGGSFILLTATDNDSRALASELKSFLSNRGVLPKQQFEFPAGTPDTAGVAAQGVASGLKIAVICAGARDSANVVRDIRRRNPSFPILTGPAAGRRGFLYRASAVAENVLVPILVEDSPVRAAFEKKFEAANGFSPDYAAMAGYDAASTLVAAVRKGGLNRVRIRDTVEEMSSWQGVTGVLSWGLRGRVERPVHLGAIRSGQVVPLDE